MQLLRSPLEAPVMNSDAQLTDLLLNRVAAGDSQAVQLLLERHRTRLKVMAGAYLDNRLVARLDPSDVVQEVLLEAAGKVRDFACSRPIAFYPWLRQIAWQRLQKVHEHHFAQKRSVARERPAELDLSTSSLIPLCSRFGEQGSSPSEALARTERNAKLRELLGRLSANDRSLLLLRYVEQLTPAECAEILCIRRDAFSKRHLRAVQRLRELLRSFAKELT